MALPAPTAAPVTLALLGYGRFGAAFAKLLVDAGVNVRAFDPHAAPPPEQAVAGLEELVRGATFVVVAVPVQQMPSALRALRPHLTPSQVVFDVGSVKVLPVEAMRDVLGIAVPWCGSHPLFGPLSLTLAERPLRVVTCPASEHPHAAERVRELYERIGCEVIEQTPEGHDRVMARTHALTFFIAKGMLDAGPGREVPFAPPSFQAISRTIETVRSDAGHLFAAIARDNPFAADARKHLVRALAAIDQALDAQVLEGNENGDGAKRLDIPDLGARSADLRRDRDALEAIDRDIVRLLARRAQAQERSAADGPASDARGSEARDADLMARRRAWAAEEKLDPEGVADVFAAIAARGRAAKGARDGRPTE